MRHLRTKAETISFCSCRGMWTGWPSKSFPSAIPVVLWEIKSQETQGLILRGEANGLDFTLLRLTINKFVLGPITGICLFLYPFRQNLLAFNDVIFPAIYGLLSLLCFSQLSDSEMWADLVKSRVPMLERDGQRCRKKQKKPHPNFANICVKEKMNLPLVCQPSCWVYSEYANGLLFWQENWCKEHTLSECLKKFQEG